MGGEFKVQNATPFNFDERGNVTVIKILSTCCSVSRNYEFESENHIIWESYKVTKNYIISFTTKWVEYLQGHKEAGRATKCRQPQHPTTLFGVLSWIWDCLVARVRGDARSTKGFLNNSVCLWKVKELDLKESVLACAIAADDKAMILGTKVWVKVNGGTSIKMLEMTSLWSSS